MTKEEAREKFKQADALFNQQDFTGSLRILTELNAAFPNQRQILYPMARSLTGLGRNSEAIDLADRIARQFDYPPALELYTRLKAMKSKDGIALNDSSSGFQLPSGVPKLDSDPIGPIPGAPAAGGAVLPSNLDSLLDRPIGGPSSPPPLPAGDGTNWKPVALWIGLAVGSYLLLLTVMTTAGRPVFEWRANLVQQQERGAEVIVNTEEIPWGRIALIACASLVSTYFISIFPGYWALRIMESLPFNNFGDDMKDIALYTLWGLLLFPIIGIGWVIYLIMLRRHYELSAGKQFIVVILWIAFDIGLGIATNFFADLAVSGIAPA